MRAPALLPEPSAKARMKKRMPSSGMRFSNETGVLLASRSLIVCECRQGRQIKSIVTTKAKAAPTTRTLMDRVNPMSSSSVSR
jgi:hypothetical protein